MKSPLIRAQSPAAYDIRINMMAMMLKFKFQYFILDTRIPEQSIQRKVFYRFFYFFNKIKFVWLYTYEF
jgi:hypothetical protein